MEDLLALNEWDPKTEKYTGASVLMKVTHLWKEPTHVREGYVIMSIVPCSVTSVCNYVPYATYAREPEGGGMMSVQDLQRAKFNSSGILDFSDNPNQ